jgi:hypothetical protein
MVKAIQDIGEARRAFDEVLETKNAIAKLEEKVVAMRQMSDSSKGIINILKTAQKDILNQFMKEVKLDLYNHSTLKQITKEDIMVIVDILKLPKKMEADRVRNLLAEVLFKRMELTITHDFKLSYHP